MSATRSASSAAARLSDIPTIGHTASEAERQASRLPASGGERGEPDRLPLAGAAQRARMVPGTGGDPGYTLVTWPSITQDHRRQALGG